jgi:hypothetical protein
VTVPALTERDVLAIWDTVAASPPPVRALHTLGRALPAERDVVEEWPVGRRDGRLLDLHTATFGERIAAVVGCPACGEELEISFRAGDVRAAEGDPDAVLELRSGKRRVRFRLPTGGDLAAVAGCRSPAEARRALARRCVLHGSVDLADRAVVRMAALIAEADPQSDVRFDLRCPDCGYAWQAPFDVADFLWRELDARARHLLADVHVLALAYGWSEGEILRLTPSRRLLYLELVGAA